LACAILPSRGGNPGATGGGHGSLGLSRSRFASELASALARLRQCARVRRRSFPVFFFFHWPRASLRRPSLPEAGQLGFQASIRSRMVMPVLIGEQIY